MKEQKLVWDAVDTILLSDLRQIVEETALWEHNSKVRVRTRMRGTDQNGAPVKRIVVQSVDPTAGNPGSK